MSVRSGQSIIAEFITSSATTGAATSADSLPTGTLVVNGTDNGASVTVTNVDTGRYKAAVTLPTLAIGDVVQLLIAATVGGIAGKGIVWRDTKDILLDSSGDVTYNNTAPPTVAAIATAIFTDTTASDFTTSGSPGKIIFTQLGGAFTTTSSSIFTTAALANAPSGGGGSVTVGGYDTGQDPATLVLDAVAASHDTSGTIGQKINSAGGAADPLLNAVPGSYAPGTAGYVIAQTDVDVLAVKAQTDQLVFNTVTYIVTGVTGSGKTIQSNSSSLMSVAAFLARADARTVGDLVVDDDTGRVAASQLSSNANLLACLADATGLLEEAVMAGKRYSAADLAGLAASSTTGQAGLFRLLTRLTMVLLFERRPDRELKLPWIYDQALKDLEQLRAGGAILPFLETAAAGLVDSHVETPQQVTDRQGLNVIGSRMIGIRGNRRGP